MNLAARAEFCKIFVMVKFLEVEHGISDPASSTWSHLNMLLYPSCLPGGLESKGQLNI